MKNNFVNKRKRKLLYFDSKYLFIFLTFIFLSIYVYSYNDKINYFASNLIQEFSNKYEYNLRDVYVSELEYIPKNEIEEYFDEFIGQSILFVPVKKLSNDILQNKWVKNLTIKNNYKDKLNVIIVEAEPLGIYNNENQRILFSYNLVALEILHSNIQYPDLITFFGEYSIKNSVKLISELDKDIKGAVKNATYIEERRWNLLLNNKILLKLPEKNIKEAINNYKKIYQNFSSSDLKDIESIDLRIKKQAIIKYRIK